jgi:hypothetical protein
LGQAQDLVSPGAQTCGPALEQPNASTAAPSSTTTDPLLVIDALPNRSVDYQARSLGYSVAVRESLAIALRAAPTFVLALPTASAQGKARG